MPILSLRIGRFFGRQIEARLLARGHIVDVFPRRLEALHHSLGRLVHGLGRLRQQMSKDFRAAELLLGRALGLLAEILLDIAETA